MSQAFTVEASSAVDNSVERVQNCESLAVIPFLVHRPPAISIRWWIQLIGHIPFVGLPIVASIWRGSRAPKA